MGNRTSERWNSCPGATARMPPCHPRGKNASRALHFHVEENYVAPHFVTHWSCCTLDPGFSVFELLPRRRLGWHDCEGWQPVWWQPIRWQPVRRQPIRRQPIRWQPLRWQPIRWQPVRWQVRQWWFVGQWWKLRRHHQLYQRFGLRWRPSRNVERDVFMFDFVG